MRNTKTCLGTDAELRPRKQGRQDKAMDEEEAKAKFKGKFVVADPIGILKEGLRSVRHHTFGWLRDDLVASGKLDGQKESLYSRVWSDYNAQLIYVRAQKDILGDDFDPLHCLPGRDIDGKFTFTKNVDVPKNHLP